MKRHVKIYFDHFNIEYDALTGHHDFIACDIQFARCTHEAVDICHIEPKGMGGNKNADRIENLIAACRNCHEDTEGRRKELLKQKQRDRIMFHDLDQSF